MKIILSVLVCLLGLMANLSLFGQDSTKYTSVMTQPAPAAFILDRIVGKVDNHILLKSEVDVAYLQAVAGGQKADTDLRCDVLQGLIINKLLMAKADIDSVTVEEKQIDDQLNNRMRYFIAQVGSEEKLEEYFNKSILQLKKDLRPQIKEQLLIQKMQDRITAKVKVTPGEVKVFFDEIPKDSLPYFSTEVEVGQIVRLPTVSKHQKELALIKIQGIRSQIVGGADFAETAKMFSEDYGSGRLGGDLGYMNKGDLVPEFESAALKLKPGQISEPVESQFGFHLIQLIDRRGSQFNSRHILIKPNSSENDIGEAVESLDSIAKAISNGEISFEKAAKDFSDDKQSADDGGMFKDHESGSTLIPLEKLDPGVFFIIDTMQVGHVTKPLPFRTVDNKEAVRIIFYKNKIAPHQANLSLDYQKIYAATVAEKKEGVLHEWFGKTKSEVFIDIDPEYSNCKILE